MYMQAKQCSLFLDALGCQLEILDKIKGVHVGTFLKFAFALFSPGTFRVIDVVKTKVCVPSTLLSND